jgi:hypothetical protein
MPGQDEEDREAYVVGLKEDLALARRTNNSNSSNGNSSNGDSSNGDSSNGNSSNGNSSNSKSSNDDSSNGDSSNSISSKSSNGNSSSYPVLTFLGTGSSIPSKYRNVSCILVQIQVKSNTKTQLKCPKGILSMFPQYPQCHLLTKIVEIDTFHPVFRIRIGFSADPDPDPLF